MCKAALDALVCTSHHPSPALALLKPLGSLGVGAYLYNTLLDSHVEPGSFLPPVYVGDTAWLPGQGSVHGLCWPLLAVIIVVRMTLLVAIAEVVEVREAVKAICFDC